MITLPIKVTSPGNGSHGHWRKSAKERSSQRRVVAWGMRTLPPAVLPVVVTLTRIGVRDLDTDNLAGAFKSVRDEVAAWLGCGDSPSDPVTWTYAQRRGAPKQYAIEINVEEVKS